MGFDTTLTYEKIWKLCDLVAAGVPYIATHPDINCPTETGFMPDIGAMMAMIAASTGKQPDVIIGKPYAPIVEALVEKLHLPVESLVHGWRPAVYRYCPGKTGLPPFWFFLAKPRGRPGRLAFSPDFVMQDLADLGER